MLANLLGRWWCLSTRPWGRSGHVRGTSGQRHGGAPWPRLALTQEAGQFGGLIVGSMLGPTVFTIRWAWALSRRRPPYLATGVLAGVITIPIGSLAGGLAAASRWGWCCNLIPIALFAVLIALGLAFLPNGMVKGFQVFGRIIVIIIISLAAAIIQKRSPHPHSGDEPPSQRAWPSWATSPWCWRGHFRWCMSSPGYSRPSDEAGHVLGMNDIAAAGLVATLANNIPCSRCSTMDRRVRSSTWPLRCPPPCVRRPSGLYAGFDSTMIFP